MTSPTKLVADDRSFSARGFGSGWNTDVGASVDSEDLSKAPLMIPFKNFEVSTVRDPGLGTVQESRNNNSLVKKEVGDVSVLINNAGMVTGKKFIDSPDSLVEKTMEVNTMAHFWTYKAFLPAMMASNHGHLVSIASSAGLIGVNGLAG
ncbi:epidermal retinol dehydrogenase 2-like isoform X2 [Emydura macquarii macquarii]|uniref:epidermal retinol dehydrogenase 2-like isoform X2 n=1 Tax=Emydura macquarii macquarii TaxID=1129001 RepID=UPI00352AE336